MAPLLQIHEPGETPAPHERSPLAVGIDLGTTNSVVAVCIDGVPRVLRDVTGASLVPSTVAFAADGSTLVGEPARRVLLDRPEAVVSSVKRLMGRGIADVKRLAGTIPYDVAPQPEGEFGMVRLTVSGRTLTPVEVSAEILKELKARAENLLDCGIDRAVITVPAYFDDAARTATKDAARLAGLEVLRLINEPTAAALAYGLDASREGIYAVFDLGGGTFDVSLLKMEKGVFQVLATGGDPALGGDDFDHAIAEHFLAERGQRQDAGTLTSGDAKMALVAARLAKECLSSQECGNWSLDVGGERSIHALDRTRLEALITPLVDRAIRICSEVLDDAGLAPTAIEGVVLVGGSTRVPLVHRRVAAMFAREPLASINPEEVVALGAALQAEALTQGSNTLLLDVTPLSLGLETMGGIVEKIIHRNTPIPVAKAQEFTTFQDGQTALALHVVQGEREMADQCRSLARFELHGIPPMVAGAARVRVSFAVDADGLLTVSAREVTTGVEQHVEVKPSYGLSDDEMAAMLEESMRNAADDMARRLLAEARVEAERLENAVTAAIATDGDLIDAAERRVVGTAIEDLRRAVQGTDRETIQEAVASLEQATRPFAERRMDRGIRQALRGHDVGEFEQQERREARGG